MLGFAKSRPAAARRLGGPRPSPDFPQCFCPAKNPCTDLQRVWVCNMDDGEVEFVYRFNNNLNPFRSFRFLLLSEKSCRSLFILLLTEPDREEVHRQMI